MFFTHPVFPGTDWFPLTPAAIFFFYNYSGKPVIPKESEPSEVSCFIVRYVPLESLLLFSTRSCR